ncbi:MAG TPA: RluA family pseudouridine synthase [Bacteroides sp.]|nr:RluA family pseudouridine synthase [Bacteroides sp.]
MEASKPDQGFTDSQELFEHHRFVVDRGQESMRLDKYLVNRMMHTSRTRIQSAAQAGNILVNDRAVKSNYKIKPGEIISIVLPDPPRETEILPEDIPLNVVYEDEEVLVINKAAGMVVHPGVGNYSGTLINALYHYFRELPMFQAGEMRPGMVHRLDKDTSGLLVIAKTELAHNRLAKQFFDRKTKRKYIALVWGDLEEDEGSIEGYIGRDQKDRTRMKVYPEESQGKHAITHYRVLERLGYINLIECRLETGRTHQIRVHFQSIRHPLFNDATYGGEQIVKGTTFTKYKQFVQNCFAILPRQALHAQSLGFTHPASGEEMFFESELPADMAEVIVKWHRYLEGRTGD